MPVTSQLITQDYTVNLDPGTQTTILSPLNDKEETAVAPTQVEVPDGLTWQIVGNDVIIKNTTGVTYAASTVRITHQHSVELPQQQVAIAAPASVVIPEAANNGITGQARIVQNGVWSYGNGAYVPAPLNGTVAGSLGQFITMAATSFRLDRSGSYIITAIGTVSSTNANIKNTALRQDPAGAATDLQVTGHQGAAVAPSEGAFAMHWYVELTNADVQAGALNTFDVAGQDGAALDGTGQQLVILVQKVA